MSKLGNILTFVKVVELQGLTNASIALCQSVSTTSRQISELEANIGHQLINRKQRKFELTTLGESYYKQALVLINQYQAMTVIAKDNVKNPVGQLKIIAPEPFVIPYIVPCIKIFCQEYNQITPYLEVSDRLIDFKYEDMDLVLSDNIQMGIINDKNHIIRRGLLQSDYILCASTRYLEKHGEINTLIQLEQHRVLCHVVHLDIHKSFLANCHSNIYIDNVYALVKCALNEMGIVLILRKYVEPYLQSGELKVVLPEYNLHGSISLYYKKTRFSNSIARLFADILAKQII